MQPRVSLEWLRKFQNGLFSQDIKMIYSKQTRAGYTKAYAMFHRYFLQMHFRKG